MQMRDYIEIGAKKAGSLTALGKLLDISQPDMSNAKAMRKPLPIAATFQLADYINADVKLVTAANELITEKDEKRRAYWQQLTGYAKAASIAMALTLVTTFVTTPNADAATLLKSSGKTLYYVNYRKKTSWKETQLFGRVLSFFEGLFKSLVSGFQPCIA